MIRWIALGLAALMITGAVACGGDDDAATGTPAPTGTTKATANKSPTAEITAYFAEFLRINTDARARLAQLDVTYPKAFKGDVQQTKDSFREYLTIFDETDDLDRALDVPAELRAVHDDVMAADEETSAISHERLDRLEDATTYAEVDVIFGEDQRFTDAVAHGDASCLALEAKAVEYGVDFDLPCEL